MDRPETRIVLPDAHTADLELIHSSGLVGRTFADTARICLGRGIRLVMIESAAFLRDRRGLARLLSADPPLKTARRAS